MVCCYYHITLYALTSFCRSTCSSNGLAVCTRIACPPMNTTGCVDEAGVRYSYGENFFLRGDPCQPWLDEQ